MISISKLSPYPKASPVILLTRRKNIPTAPPAARESGGISLPQKACIMIKSTPHKRNKRESLLFLISITARIPIYPANIT